VDRAREVRGEIDAAGFDLLLIFHPTYMIGDVAFELMKSRAAIGLWAVEEPSRQGSLPLASLVCLNQNAAIAERYLRERRFKWFLGEVDGRFFRRRLEITVRALKASARLGGARVAQIGRVAPGFMDMHYDQRALFENLGVTVVRGIEIDEVLAAADALESGPVRAELERLEAGCAAVEVGAGKMEDSVRLFLATRRICEENAFDAVAFSCWPRLGELRNMKPCVSDALLDSCGIPASCEGDMLSAISMLALSAMGARTVAVMDLPAFDVDGDALLLWHCGSAPAEMADGRGWRCRYHYRAAFGDRKGDDRDGPVTDMVFAPGPVTVFRFAGEGEAFFCFGGEVFDDGRDSWDGSRGWVRNLKLGGRPVSSLDLMNTVMSGGLPHHYPMTLEDLCEEVDELGAWKGLRPVPVMPYADGLRAR